MLSSIRKALAGGLPCIAECGGVRYLTQAIAGRPMVGRLPGECFDAGKLVRFGYVELTAVEDNMLCRAGESIRGHEFHRWDCNSPAAASSRQSPAAKPGPAPWPRTGSTPGIPTSISMPTPPLPKAFMRHV